MASCSQRRIQAFLADGAIALGKAVKVGSDNKHVAAGSANTSLCLGICQGAVTTAEDQVEIALPGGGAKALAGESISAGKMLVSHTDGSLVQANASGDRIIAMAMEDASAGDIFAVEVVVGLATGADV